MIMGNCSVRATSVLLKPIFFRPHVHKKRDWKINLCFRLNVVLLPSYCFPSCFGPRSKRRLSWAQLIKTPKRLERLHHEDDSCPKPVVVHHVTPMPRPSYLYDDNDKIPGVMPIVHLVGSKQWHNRKHLVDFSKPFLSSLICIISHTLYNKPTL